MKYLALLAAVVLVGGTVSACTDETYNGRTQYGYNNDRNQNGIPDNREGRRDSDRDGVPNNRDRAPNNPYYR